MKIRVATYLFPLALALIVAANAAAMELGRVSDKRAPGLPGDKTFQVEVNNRWVGVPEDLWDSCNPGERMIHCRSEYLKARGVAGNLRKEEADDLLRNIPGRASG